MALLLSGVEVSPAISERPTHVQAVLAESEARRNRHAQELEGIRASREQVEAQLAAAEAKLAATQVAMAKVRQSCPSNVQARRPATALSAILEPQRSQMELRAPARIKLLQCQAPSCSDHDALLLRFAPAAASIWHCACHALKAVEMMPVNVQSGESPSRDTLPPPQPAAGNEEGLKARLEAELAASRSQAAALQQQLADAQQAAAAAEAAAAEDGAKLSSTQAELAAERAEAGQRAAQSARWASAADATTAELNKRNVALEDAAKKAKAAAHDELVACRDSGMKVIIMQSLPCTSASESSNVPQAPTLQC